MRRYASTTTYTEVHCINVLEITKLNLLTFEDYLENSPRASPAPKIPHALKVICTFAIFI